MLSEISFSMSWLPQALVARPVVAACGHLLAPFFFYSSILTCLQLAGMFAAHFQALRNDCCAFMLDNYWANRKVDLVHISNERARDKAVIW